MKPWLANAWISTGRPCEVAAALASGAGIGGAAGATGGDGTDGGRAASTAGGALTDCATSTVGGPSSLGSSGEAFAEPPALATTTMKTADQAPRHRATCAKARAGLPWCMRKGILCVMARALPPKGPTTDRRCDPTRSPVGGQETANDWLCAVISLIR